MTPHLEEHPVWGAGVRFLRIVRGMTQVELAEKAQTTQGRISQIETGSPAISDAMRVRISRALGVEPHSLFPYRDDQAS